MALGPGSLAGLPRLQHLALAHNYLQAVSGAWLRPLPSLQTLLLMDNDISLVEEGSLDTLANLTEINLAGELSTYSSTYRAAPAGAGWQKIEKLCVCPVFLPPVQHSAFPVCLSLLSATSQLINIHEPE